jgi:hypothetical protein
MRLIAFLTEHSSIEQILTHLGEPTLPPPVAPARAPPDHADLAQGPTWEIGVDPVPEIDFDQRHGW